MGATRVFGCLSAVVVLVCGTCGAILFALGDDCMDNDIFMRMRTDGLNIYLKHAYYLAEQKLVTDNHSQIDFSVEELSSGISHIKISLGNAKASRKAFSISDAVWSSTRQTLYFCEHARPVGAEPTSSRLMGWSVARGFWNIGGPIFDLRELSLSLDDKAITYVDWSDINMPKIQTYDLATEKNTTLVSPDGTLRAVQVNRDDYLVVIHHEGNYAFVHKWSPKTGKKPKLINEMSPTLGGTLTDCVAMNGNVWALQSGGSNQNVVRLDASLAKVVEDIGHFDYKLGDRQDEERIAKIYSETAPK